VACGLKVFLRFVVVVLPVACSPQPQTHPLDTAPVPASARILEEPCSPLGAMMCGAVSIALTAAGDPWIKTNDDRGRERS